MTAFQDGDFLARWNAKNCPNMDEWSVKNFKSEAAKKVFSNKRYIDAVNELAKALGKPVNMTNFISYYDNLICMQYMGKEVPFFTPS
jgi:hypothetical protein